MIVDGQLEEPGHGDEHGENADAVEPLGADAVFEGAAVLRRGGG